MPHSAQTIYEDEHRQLTSKEPASSLQSEFCDGMRIATWFAATIPVGDVQYTV
jgi:hypothetical protein